MARESKFWTETVKPNLSGFSQRIETPITSGTPDVVNIIRGVMSWIELKDKPTWETCLGTTKIQRYWLKRWYQHGGNSYLLARCGTETFFIAGKDIEIDGSQTREELREVSLVHSFYRFAPGQWIQVNALLATGLH